MDFLRRLGTVIVGIIAVAGLVGVIGGTFYGGMLVERNFHWGQTVLAGGAPTQITVTPDDKSVQIASLTKQVGEMQSKLEAAQAAKSDLDRTKAEIKTTQGNLVVAQGQFAQEKSRADQAEGKLAAAQAAVEQAKGQLAAVQTAKEQPVAAPAKDTRWEGFDETSRLFEAHNIYADKCGAEAQDKFDEATRQMILGATSRQEVEGKLDCSAKERVAAAPGTTQPTEQAPEVSPAARTAPAGGGCPSGTVYVSQFGACVPRLNRR